MLTQGRCALCVLCVVLRRIFFFSPSEGFSLACFGFGFGLYLAEMSTSGVSLVGNCDAAVGRSTRMLHASTWVISACSS
jgi:hypothetical protein